MQIRTNYISSGKISGHILKNKSYLSCRTLHAFAGVYIFLFAPKIWAFDGLGKKMITSLSKKGKREKI